MIVPDSHTAAVLVLASGTRLPIRIIRQLDNAVYCDTLAERDWGFIPPLGETVALRWVTDDHSVYQQEGKLSEILTHAAIFVIIVQGVPQIIEQRHHLRVSLAIPIEYQMLRTGAISYAATTIDLSSVGLRFPSAIPLWKNLHLKIRLHLPSTELSLRAKIVRISAMPVEIHRSEAWDTAISYIQITEPDRQLLEEFVQVHAQRHRQQKPDIS
jgi:hypothetical protein